MPLLTFPQRYLALAELQETSEGGKVRYVADPNAPKQYTPAQAIAAAPTEETEP